MFGVIGLFVLMCATSRANVAVTPPAPPGVTCGEIPAQIYSCANLPSIISAGAGNKCSESSECQRITCKVRESGWLDGAGVNTARLSKHLEQFSSDHPEWAAAVQQAKTSCLVPNLPAQGYDVNCPAYDVTFCILSSFIKNVPPSRWRSSDSCEYSRQFAAACPVCPSDCFVPAIPVGSCNACRGLPRSP